jgi:hypothetical protein
VGVNEDTGATGLTVPRGSWRIGFVGAIGQQPVAAKLSGIVEIDET